MTSQKEALTVSGFIQVLPKSVDKDIAKVALVTADGTEYPILHKGAGVDLIDHVSANVEVRAVLEETPLLEGGQALKVRSYTFTDGYDDPWYDDDDE